MNIDFLEVAARELDDAFAYYEYQQQNLGHRFIYEVWNTIERIRYYPKAWHGFSPNTRRCLVKNFLMGLSIKQKMPILYL